jgi:hypothetical protein
MFSDVVALVDAATDDDLNELLGAVCEGTET